jgi:DNA-binding GntR family transcriptional regulator
VKTVRFQQRYRNSLKICDFSNAPMNRRKLHEQARRAIERLIANRGIKAGSRIPSESKLAGELYVSRTTIRRALKDLEEEGKIEQITGGMTIVRQTCPKKVPKQNWQSPKKYSLG